MIKPKNTAITSFIYILTAIVCGYVFTWGFITLGVTGLVFIGIDFHTAEISLYMLAFIIYTIIFLWFFTFKKLWYAGVVFLSCGLLMTLAGYSLQNFLLA